jgi:Lamin Tail Domain/Immunoglobulin domain
MVALTVMPAMATTYYVDSAAGNDANSGTATNSAWQSLTKINGTTFAAGDILLLKNGSSWTGTLSPQGSGSSGNPIILSSYGTNASRPLINGNGATDAVYFNNQPYWEINNLEVVNPGAGSSTERRGIHLAASNFGVVNHMYVSNCFVHNICGRVDTSNGDLTAKRSGGIIVEIVSDSSVPSRFNDIVIQNCTIMSVTNQGIVACANRTTASAFPGTSSWNQNYCSNVKIRNNVISDVCKNAMSFRYGDESCVIEHNLIHDTANATDGNQICTYSTRGSVIQYNEGYHNNGNGAADGSFFDADLNSPATVCQYNYSHDNTWGLWVDYTGGADNHQICRYNISQNDQGEIFHFSGTGTASVYIYNNTVYIPANLSPLLFNDHSSGHTYYVYNNIFYNLSSGAKYSFSSGNTHTFDYNVFYGQHPSSEPSDANKLTSDPLLVAPGTGGGVGGTNNMTTLGGYLLQSNSPCIDSGLTITTNMTGNANAVVFDFFGNPIPPNSRTDRGAAEWVGAVNANPPPLILTAPADLEVCLGSPASFSVVATNSALSYQWFEGGNSLAGQTNATLLINSTTLNDATNFFVVVTNIYGATTSGVAVLTVDVGNPAIGLQPTNQIAVAGSFVEFAVTVTNDLSPSYQWRLNSNSIPGATFSVYDIASASTNDVGSYDVIVANDCGSVTSLVATLTLDTNQPPSIAIQPISVTNCLGSPVSFTVAAGGSGPLNYQWQKNTLTLNGQTNATLSFGSITTNDVANYNVIITNSLGSVTSSVANLMVTLPPTITVQPTNQTVFAGANVSFSVAASGTSPFSYQWRTNGGAITRGTNSTFALTGVTIANAANYDVVVANSCGSVTSSVASLTVTNSSGGGGSSVVIAEVYAGGGKTGAAYDHDYVVLKNIGSSSVSLAGWSLQHDKVGTWQTPYAFTNANATIPPGGYYLIQCYNDVGTGAGASLPTPDEIAPQSSVWNMSYLSADAVALVTNTVAVSNSIAGTAGNISVSAAAAAGIVDLVGASTNTGNCYLVGITPAGSAANAVTRLSSGCQNTQNNSADFVAAPPSPKNSSSPVASCIATLPTVATTLAATGVTAGAATLNGSVNPNGLATTWYFQYGTNAGYGSYTTTNSLVAGTSTVGVSNLLTGLVAGTNYHYQLVATSSSGSSNGGDTNFSTLTVSSPQLLAPQFSLGSGAQFSFIGTPGASFTILGSTNLTLPLSNWTVLGVATESPAGHYNFTDPQATNNVQRFYKARSP